jgi:hypothetical protein
LGRPPRRVPVRRRHATDAAWRSPCSTSSRRPPLGRRCPLRMRLPPLIPSSPPTRMEQRQPGRRLPRWSRGLSRRLPPAAARQGKGRGRAGGGVRVFALVSPPRRRRERGAQWGFAFSIANGGLNEPDYRLVMLNQQDLVRHEHFFPFLMLHMFVVFVTS